MMNESAIKTLLAFWLAQQDTEVQLSQAEKSAIEELCHRLSENPHTWDSVQQELISRIQKNESLNQTFQYVQDRLEKLDAEELLELLPTLLTDSEQKNHFISPVFTYDTISTDQNFGRIERLLAQLKSEILAQKLEEDEDEKFAFACELVDELELGWEDEWQEAAITDWEVSGL
ncbi:MAG: hypothetical protein WAN66_20090 [Limnoraphis robusta]|uniref:hypothetical protein n=1 Tax=Limnoraphis robusta TaxID=1118279 RepID=UPI0019104CC8|nr:hypothetical protein [Limnoraphis robusta]